MTVVYLVRHAESDKSRGDERTRGLSQRGMQDRELVTQYLADKQIHAAFSSPYRRAVETIAPFAGMRGLCVHSVEDLREWHRRGDHSVDFGEFCRRHWADPDYRYADGESLGQVERRNVAVLEGILHDFEGQNVIVGTHGMAMSTLLHHYDPHFGYDAFVRLLPLMPLIVKMTFEETRCIRIRQIELR